MNVVNELVPRKINPKNFRNSIGIKGFLSLEKEGVIVSEAVVGIVVWNHSFIFFLVLGKKQLWIDWRRLFGAEQIGQITDGHPGSLLIVLRCVESGSRWPISLLLLCLKEIRIGKDFLTLRSRHLLL